MGRQKKKLFRPSGLRAECRRFLTHTVNACYLAACISTLAGCGSSSPHAAPTAQQDVERTFQQQIQAVGAGTTDEILVSRQMLGDSDLSRLRHIATRLRVLRLQNTTITDEGIEAIAACTKLEWLELRGAAIGDEGMRQLSGLVALRNLNLPQADFSDNGLSAITPLDQLELLRFGTQRVTDAGIAHLRQLPSLRFLHLIHVPVTDACLDDVAAIDTLESFYIDGGRLTDEGISRLIRSRRDLHFHQDQHHHDSDPRSTDGHH